MWHVSRIRQFVALLPAAFMIAACSQTGGNSSGQSAGGSGSSSGSLQRIKSSGVLRDCVYPQYPPELFKQNGQPAGFSIDLVKEMATALKVKPQFVELSFQGIIPALQANKCDISITGMTPTAPRALAVAFGKIEFLYNVGLMVRSSETRTTIADFNQPSVKICVQTATESQFKQQQYFPKVQVTSLADIGDCFLQVESGRVDAVPIEAIITNQFRLKHPDVKEILDTQGGLGVDSSAPVFQHDDTEFRDWVDLFIGQFIATGKYADLFQKDVGFPADIPELMLERGSNT